MPYPVIQVVLDANLKIISIVQFIAYSAHHIAVKDLVIRQVNHFLSLFLMNSTRHFSCLPFSFPQIIFCKEYINNITILLVVVLVTMMVVRVVAGHVDIVDNHSVKAYLIH